MGLSLTWLTNHCPSVLWHCWLGHMTCKIVSEMTHNVSSGMLNVTILYHTIMFSIWLFVCPSVCYQYFENEWSDFASNRYTGQLDEVIIFGEWVGQRSWLHNDKIRFGGLASFVCLFVSSVSFVTSAMEQLQWPQSGCHQVFHRCFIIRVKLYHVKFMLMVGAYSWWP